MTITEHSTHQDTVEQLRKTHDAYLQRKFDIYHDNALDEMLSFDRETIREDRMDDRLKKLKLQGKSDYPESKEAEEAHKRHVAAINAAIHTGERRWHQQG